MLNICKDERAAFMVLARLIDESGENVCVQKNVGAQVVVVSEIFVIVV